MKIRDIVSLQDLVDYVKQAKTPAMADTKQENEESKKQLIAPNVADKKAKEMTMPNVYKKKGIGKKKKVQREKITIKDTNTGKVYTRRTIWQKPTANINESLLLEGTWSSPNTAEKARELVQLIRKPLSAGQAHKKLYNLLGNDRLYDLIDEIREKDGPENDVSELVRSYIQDMMMTFNPDDWTVEWEPEAIETLQQV